MPIVFPGIGLHRLKEVSNVLSSNDPEDEKLYYLRDVPAGTFAICHRKETDGGRNPHAGRKEKLVGKLFQKSKEDGGYLKYADTFKRITEEMGVLKGKKSSLLAQMESGCDANRRIRDAVGILTAGDPQFDGWNETTVRQVVDTVTVLAADRIRVRLRGGMEFEQTIEADR